MIALSDPGAIGARIPVAPVVSLASLAFLVWGITTEAHLGLGGRHVVASISLALAVVGWVVWVAARHAGNLRLAAVALTTVGLAGGVLAAFAPLALVFVGLAALGATMAWDFPMAVWIALSGLAAMAVALPLAGHDLVPLAGGAAAVVTGSAIGVSRRESLRAATQQAQIQVSEARAEAEEARAELLAGRNHLARELHDVLAHTLSALSLQLEALDAVVNAGSDPAPEVRDRLEATKRLVRTGLDEARGAVRALREDVPPLEGQLATLADDRGATLHVSGQSRRLGADVSLALYRVAQEALTNTVKHAPGSTAVVELAFEDTCVCLSITNDRSRANGSSLADSGSGVGIQGIRERVLLLGGQVEAGPTEDGWRVRAEVPA